MFSAAQTEVLKFFSVYFSNLGATRAPRSRAAWRGVAWRGEMSVAWCSAARHTAARPAPRSAGQLTSYFIFLLLLAGAKRQLKEGLRNKSGGLACPCRAGRGERCAKGVRMVVSSQKCIPFPTASRPSEQRYANMHHFRAPPPPPFPSSSSELAGCLFRNVFLLGFCAIARRPHLRGAEWRYPTS